MASSRSGPKLKLAVIGPGLIGMRHLEIAMANPRIEVTGVVRDSSQPILGLHTCFSLDDLPEKPDAVIIASPSSKRVEHLKAALEKGLYCLVEKPILDSSLDMAELEGFDLSRVQVAHHRLHSLRVKKLFEIVFSGVLGCVQSYGLFCTYNKPLEYFEERPWRLSESGGVAKINLIHEISILSSLFGSVVASNGFMLERSRPSVHPDSFVASIAHNSGVIGSMVVGDCLGSWLNYESFAGEDPNFPKLDGDYLQIIGRAGTLSFPSLTITSSCEGSIAWKASPEVRSQSLSSVNVEDPIVIQMNEFLDFINGGINPVTFEMGFNFLKDIEFISHSLNKVN